MKKHWIVTAILVVFCTAVPVFASEALPGLEAQVKDILVRLEKVEAYEERIAALESQIAELTSPPVEPATIPSEDTVVMSELEYWTWLGEEMIKVEDRSGEFEALLESEDPANVITALSEMLGMLFEFHDAHSQIETTATEYDEIQSLLTCVVEEFEPLRDIEDKTVGEAIAALTPLFIVLMDNPDNLFKDCDLDALDDALDALDAYGEQFFE